MVTGSFVCGCGKPFNRSGDLTRHRRYCSSQPTPPKQTVDVAECSVVKVISPGTSITAQAKIVPDPVLWNQDPAILIR